MNKVTKGTLAAAAAGALLLGGVGTYATWSDQTNVTASQVSAGHLTLTEASTDGWKYVGATNFVQSAVIVPGDTLSAVYKVTVDAAGDNIRGNLALTGMQDDTAGDITVAYKHIQDSTDTTAMTVSGNTYSFAEAGVYDLLVEVTVTYNSNATVQPTGGDISAELNFAQMTLDLTQTLATTTSVL